MGLLLTALGSINWNVNHLFCPVFSVRDVGNERNHSALFNWLEWDDSHLPEEAETWIVPWNCCWITKALTQDLSPTMNNSISQDVTNWCDLAKFYFSLWLYSRSDQTHRKPLPRAGPGNVERIWTVWETRRGNGRGIWEPELRRWIQGKFGALGHWSFFVGLPLNIGHHNPFIPHNLFIPFLLNPSVS